MEILFFILRLAVLAALYGFLAVVLWMVWREFKWAAGLANESARPSSARMCVLERGETDLAVGDVLRLDRSTTLGRSPDSGIVLADPSVSARHATITCENGCWWIEDTGSTNGTLLNDEPVRRKLPLRAHDVLAFGQVRLQLEDDANALGGQT
jgi:hypothetical protein